MSLREKLEIYLITYNRQNALKHTLERLLEEGSPLKGVTIYVLDNKSPDGTKTVVEGFIAKHSNLHYICNKYNVGLGGNLIKAMEMASKPYFWILCDDDNFNWGAWPEVGEAIQSGKYDIVMTTYTTGFRSEEIPFLINEMCFVPSAIYKTSHIDNTVMTNAYAMAHNLFPFHALSTKIINNKGKIFVPQGRVVLQDYGQKSHQTTRGTKLRRDIYLRLQKFSLLWGYVDSYTLIKDKRLRHECMDVLCLGQSFLGPMTTFIKWFPFTWQNLFDIFCYVSIRQKIQIILAVIINNPILGFYSTEKGLNIRIFSILKTRILPYRKRKK